jgi:anti-sigma factor ChrR (cupin superfamily)
MARKARRYFPTRRDVGRPRQDPSEHDAQITAAARQLVEQHTPAELQARLADCTALLAQADQEGTQNPGPVRLARFRRARTEWEVAQRAVDLSTS